MIIDDFKEILEKFQDESKKPFKNNEFASKMRNEFTENFKEFVFNILKNKDKYDAKVSPGMTGWTKRPWAGLLNLNSTNTFQGGLYLIYIFDFKKNGFHLSLDQGSNFPTNKIRQKISNHLIDIVTEEKLNIPVGFVFDETKLYEDTVLSKFYDINKISIEELENDLKSLIEIYEYLIPKYIEYVKTEEAFADDLRPEDDGIRIWRIAPGSSEIYDEVWDEFKKESYVGIGFTNGNDKVDFSEFKNKFAINHHLNNNLFVSKDSTDMVWKFIKWIRKGDIIIANKGRSKLAGIGIVTGDFMSQTDNKSKNDFGLNNIYSVDWIFTPDELEVRRNLFARHTLVEWTNLSDKWNELIFTLSRTDDELKDKLLNYLFHSFDKDYLKKDIGIQHQSAYATEEEYIQYQWSQISKKEMYRENISEDIWNKIINREIKIHSDVVTDVKSTIKGKFKYSDEDLSIVAKLYYDTINKLIGTNDENYQKVILKEYDDDKYADGFGTGRFSPVLHYLKPEFYVINNKTIATVNLLSLILGEKLELNHSLEDYVDNNNKYKNFLHKLKNISPYHIDISKFEIADAFAHWMCDSGLGNYAGKNPNPIPPELILESGIGDDCDVDELFEFPENLDERAIEIFKDLYCNLDKWRDGLSGEGITIPEYSNLQKGFISDASLYFFFESLTLTGFLKLISSKPKRYDLVEMIIEEYSPINMNYELFESKLQGFAISDDIVYQTCASLNAGKHIIFDGTPGTGKTEIALKFSSVASENKFVDGHALTTATSDWSTFDTIGGLMPNRRGNLEFRQGKFLEAIEQNKWLIIDEINRADIDKAFGQLFTVLSGQDVELPYKENGKSIKIKTWDELYCKHDEKTATYYIGSNWRVIGTMNVDDKDSLYDLSYAFMRRFMFIEVDLPCKEDYLKIIGQWSNNLDSYYQEKLIDLYGIVQYRKIGPAIFKDMISYIKERDKLDSSDYDKILGEAINSYILPQLEGLNRKIIKDIENFFDEINLLDYISDKFDDLKLDL